MRKLLFLICLSALFSVNAQNNFQSTYLNHPTLPSGILEAVSWTNTRMQHLENQQESCSGYPQAYGIMGLHDDGKGYFLENGVKIAELSGISISEQKLNAENQIEAYAIALETHLEGSTDGNAVKAALYALSEIPDSGMVNFLARDLQVFEVLRFMSNSDRAEEFGFSPQHYNLVSIFGSVNYEVLSSDKIEVSETGITNGQGAAYTLNANASLQYGPAIWNPAAVCNFSSRQGVAISAITIHTIQGTYAGAISWAQNCNSGVSYHYVVRSSDGQITQMVLEEDKAWHVGSENPYTIGYEHEGYVDNPIWYTEAMYNASADLSRDIVNSGYGIPPLRTYYGPASIGTNTLGGCTKIKGHQHFPNQSHTDPGIYWNWEKYYLLINNTPTITTISNSSGLHTDSGGSTGNYSDDERTLWLFQPSNVSSISLDFTSFDLEMDYDYLFIYDGDSIGSPLIGQFSGTNSPGNVTSSGGSLLLEFRSDCGTTAPGWEANFTSVPIDVTSPNTSITAGATWQTDDFNIDFVDFDAESSIKERFYLVSEKAITENAPHSNGNFGFANESFADNANNWTDVTGVYSLQSETFNFADTSEQNSNTFLSVNQTVGSEYLFEWTQNITSSAVNQRAGMHFFCDDPTLTNRGNSYFVYLRANSDLVQIYRVANNVFSLELDANYVIDENTDYTCRVHYDPASGWIRVFINGDFVSEWQDPNPFQSGNSISLRTGGCTAIFDDIKVFKSRGTSVTIPSGFGDAMSIESENAVATGFVYSLVTDSMDNWSALVEEDYLLDFSAPIIPYLNDGTNSDIDTFFSATIAANWFTQDIHSGILESEYAIGTSSGLADVVAWTTIGLNSSISQILSNPIYDQVYFISVRVRNNADLMDELSSDGQRYIDDLGISTNNLSSASLFPNPTNSYFTISGIEGTVKGSIYALSGKHCMDFEAQTNDNISIAGFAAGEYQVLLRNRDQMVVKKIIVID